jgi:hypothetical protein
LVSPEREFLELAEPTKGYGSSSTTAELKKEYSRAELPDYFINVIKRLALLCLELTAGW